MSSVSLLGDLLKKHYPTFYSMEAGWGIETNVDALAGVIDRSILHPLSKQTKNMFWLYLNMVQEGLAHNRSWAKYGFRAIGLCPHSFQKPIGLGHLQKEAHRAQPVEKKNLGIYLEFSLVNQHAFTLCSLIIGVLLIRWVLFW